MFGGGCGGEGGWWVYPHTGSSSSDGGVHKHIWLWQRCPQAELAPTAVGFCVCVNMCVCTCVRALLCAQPATAAARA